jgi:hypothetical protein
LLIYEQSPVISLEVGVHSISREVQAFLRECVCMSTIIVVSPYKRSVAPKDEPVLLLIAEFPPAQDVFHIDGFISTMKSVRVRIFLS